MVIARQHINRRVRTKQDAQQTMNQPLMGKWYLWVGFREKLDTRSGSGKAQDRPAFMYCCGFVTWS